MSDFTVERRNPKNCVDGKEHNLFICYNGSIAKLHCTKCDLYIERKGSEGGLRHEDIMKLKDWIGSE